MSFRSLFLWAALAAMTTQATADTVDLGTAGDFAVLAGQTVTNTGPSVIGGGSVGVSPGSAVVGFPPGLVLAPGTIHAADAVALQAQTDLTAAYVVAAGLASTQDLTGQDLGGLTLVPGVYTFTSSAQLTGTLTLNALNDPAALFVFQVASLLNTASSAAVMTINSGVGTAAGCNVYWQVGSSATLGTDTSFLGHILALTSISMNTGATLLGSALARNGSVTLDNNVITNADCDNAGNLTGAPIPEPATITLLLVAGAFLAHRVRAKRGASIARRSNLD